MAGRSRRSLVPGALTKQLRHPWRVEADHLERIPDGACILAVNRVSPFDHWMVPASLNRDSRVIAGGLPIRSRHKVNWQADPDADDSPQAAAAAGAILVVFPEGDNSADGCVHKGHAQFAAFALEEDLPVVPAALVPFAAQGTLPELRYRLRIGEAVDTTRFTQAHIPSDALDGFVLRALTDLVITRICQLAGRRYVDNYAATTGAVAKVTRPAAFASWREGRAERRAALEQRRAAEAELARLLDEQDAAIMDEAVEAARSQAEKAALATEHARAQRRHLAGQHLPKTDDDQAGRPDE